MIVREYVQKNEEDGLRDQAVLNMRWAMRSVEGREGEHRVLRVVCVDALCVVCAVLRACLFYVSESLAINDRVSLSTIPLPRERSLPPRFASRGTYEEVACQKWKQLFESQETRTKEQQKVFRDEKEALEKELDSQRGNVEAEMYRLGELTLFILLRVRVQQAIVASIYSSCVFVCVRTCIRTHVHVYAVLLSCVYIVGLCVYVSPRKDHVVIVCALVVLNWRDNKVDSFTGSGPSPCPLVMPRMSDKSFKHVVKGPHSLFYCQSLCVADPSYCPQCSEVSTFEDWHASGWWTGCFFA